MEWDYDLIVIGTGVAGSDVAWHCRGAGMRVAITDYRSYGGTCALRGCVPKKILASAAGIVAQSRNLKGSGIAGDLSIDWPRLIAFERSLIDPTPQRKEEGFEKAGIHTLHRPARFVGPNQVAIGDDIFSTRYIAIATGAEPRPLNVPGADLITLSDDFFYLKDLPEKIVFIGGGYISFEFAHLAARAGAKTTILQRSDRVLSGFDPDIVSRLVQASEEIGISVRLNMPLVEVEKTDGGLLVHAGKEETIEADMVVHGAGRISAIRGLDLAAGGVETDRRGILINDYLQSTSNPAVYVAGDANTKSPQLTPVAALDARIVADNIIHGNTRTPDYSVVPGAVFTNPPIASVGLTEEAAEKSGIAYTVSAGDLSGRFTNRSIGERHAGYRILIEEGSGRILGAHLIGHGAEEVINVFALAIKSGSAVDDLAIDSIPWAYPSHTYDIAHMSTR